MKRGKLARAPSGKAEFEHSYLEVRMFNVGHGEVILLIFPQRRAWLIDGGSSNSSNLNEKLGEGLVDYLGERDLTLEAFVPSHPHKDHVGAVAAALASGSSQIAPAVAIYRSEDATWNLDKTWLNEFRDAIAGHGNVEVLALRNAHRMPLREGTRQPLRSGGLPSRCPQGDAPRQQQRDGDWSWIRCSGSEGVRVRGLSTRPSSTATSSCGRTGESTAKAFSATSRSRHPADSRTTSALGSGRWKTSRDPPPTTRTASKSIRLPEARAQFLPGRLGPEPCSFLDDRRRCPTRSDVHRERAVPYSTS